MRFTRLKLANWRNFPNVDAPLQKRVFLVGPNASGKSNFLDAFRFFRDIAEDQGGFHRAVQSRKGISALRSLHARGYPNIVLEAEVELDAHLWRYRLEFTQDNRRPVIRRELVQCGAKVLLDRPDDQDRLDPDRLTQTHLEQVNANRPFRELADFFAQIRYLHIVPQLVREPDRSVGRQRDPFGGDFLEQLSATPTRTLNARLRKILKGMKVAVPHLTHLKLARDEKGMPHLQGRYAHWRPKNGWQTEDQFSDGTLRLFGLLWVFLDGAAPLLLEEPELSLHFAVVRKIPGIMAKLGSRVGRQVMISTQSADLLADPGIAPEEVLLLKPTREGTLIEVAAHNVQIRSLLEKGCSMDRAVLPHTAPQDVEQLVLFGNEA